MGFHGIDKSRYINLTEEGRCATKVARYYPGGNTGYTGYGLLGTVRATDWCHPTARASATVRVDRVGYDGVAIGVLSSRYTGRWHLTHPARRVGWQDIRLRPWENNMTLWGKRWAWCYHNYNNRSIFNRRVTRIGHIINAGILRNNLPALVAGSVVRVTLDAHRVIFNVDGHDYHAVTLPQDCGLISLGVSMPNGSKVTLLP